MIRLLVFDLDGTLVDSVHDIVASVNELMQMRGLTPLPPPVIKGAIGGGLKVLVRNLFPERLEDTDFLAGIDRDLMELYDKRLLDTTVPFPGAIPFLSGCTQKLAVLSNKHEAFVKRTVDALELRRFPWVKVYGGDSFPVKKPDPLPLREIMKAAGCGPEETLMIGDGVPDLKVAAAAGVRAIACEFGYTDLETLRALQPYATLKTFFDLQSLVESIR